MLIFNFIIILLISLTQAKPESELIQILIKNHFSNREIDSKTCALMSFGNDFGYSDSIRIHFDLKGNVTMEIG